MRLLTTLVLVLLLSSCQQRYGHVKRVKADKTQTARAKEKEKLQADSSALQAYSDSSVLTISGSTGVPDKLQEDMLTVIPEKKGSGKKKELSPGEKPKLPSHLNKIFPGIPDGPGEEPLTKQEKLLILAIFTIWTILIVAGVQILVVTLFAEFLLFGVLFGGGSFIFGVILIFLLVGFVLSILTFFIAQSRIRKRIPKQIDSFELVPYFLLVLVCVGLLMKIWFLPPLLLIILILAIVYSLRYDRKTNSTN